MDLDEDKKEGPTESAAGEVIPECATAADKAEEEDDGGGDVKEEGGDETSKEEEDIPEKRTEGETSGSKSEVALEEASAVVPEKEKVTDEEKDEKVSEAGDDASKDPFEPLPKEDESVQEERREETGSIVRQSPDVEEGEVMEVEVAALAESDETVKIVDRVEGPLTEDSAPNEKEETAGGDHREQEREGERREQVSEVRETESGNDCATSGIEDEAQGSDGAAVVEDTPPDDVGEKLEPDESSRMEVESTTEKAETKEEEERSEEDTRVAELFSQRRRALKERKLKIQQKAKGLLLRTERRAEMMEAAHAYKPAPEVAKSPPAKRCRVLLAQAGEGEAAAAKAERAAAPASVVVDLTPTTTPNLIIRDAFFSCDPLSPQLILT